jgi:hypothetical protein
MADRLDTGFRTTVLKMAKDLRDGVGKVKKMIYEQNGNINR